MKDVNESPSDEPVMTLPMTPVVTRPASNTPTQQPPAPNKAYSTLPLTPVVTRPISEPLSAPAAKPTTSSGLFQRSPSGMFSKPLNAPPAEPPGGGTMIGLSAVRHPMSAPAKPFTTEQAPEEPPNPIGASTMLGVATVSRADIEQPSSEFSLEETSLPDAATTLVGDQIEAPVLSPNDPPGSGTLFGRVPSKEILSQQLRAMDISPVKPEALQSVPEIGAPPLGKPIARMDQPPGATTDMVPMYGEDSIEETNPDRQLLEAPRKEEPPAPLPPPKKEAPVEAPKPFSQSSERPIDSHDISFNSPDEPPSRGGTAMMVKKALDIAETRPDSPAEDEPLPGSRGARIVGVAAGLLLLIAALLPVGVDFTPAWQMISQKREALLLAVWGGIGLIAIVASFVKLNPFPRGLIFALAAFPALILGALWGVSFFGELLAPAVTEASKHIAPAIKPRAATDTTYLQNLAALTPPWRVGLFIFGWTLLPAALFYRRFDTASIPARLMVTTGSAVVIANYLIPFEGGFLSSLLAPVVGSSETASKILGDGPVALYSLVFHLLSTGDLILVFFGVVFVIPIALALLSFTAFFPGEQVSRGVDGALRITTPVLSTGASGIWASLFLLYLPIPMVVLGAILCLDPGQRASGFVFLRFGLVVGALPLLFSVGLGQALAAKTFRRGV
jgi:hypothetical protein